ncbi:hypothetical protein [Natronorubrum bangense]|uniref:Domain of unknown function domain-containing protein n=2 Tax=Natronorubrum bangense TaxID=61858 RepID=L9WJJ9_9EURY|nr:hypothetical protein [Natronorubrum bangense]ELY48513.1 hypothetical protein C494_10880 [Natronorubrum bangense JCM 10635]QCC53812.1 hypothetical protein DV706_04495 [Natronorubrum bangense]
MNSDIDRERGVLSPADRAYLLGEREMSHEQSKRNAEARIRRRIHAAVLDFDLLLHTLPEKDRKQLFVQTTTDDAFLDGLRALVAFLYLGTETYGVDFEDVLEPAIRSSEEYLAATDREANVSVDVTFGVETTVESSLEGVAARLDADEPVTPRELFSLVMQGTYDARSHDRITLVRTDDEQTPDGFLERLASYLDGELRSVSDSRAVIRLEGMAADADDQC